MALPEVHALVAQVFQAVRARHTEAPGAGSGSGASQPVPCASASCARCPPAAGAAAADPEWGPANDMTCAICLEQMELADVATVKGCEHLYCVNCILQWAGKSCEGKTMPKCPVCKSPFEFLHVHRQLDGSLSDFPTEESVTLLRRARWFQSHAKQEDDELALFNPAEYRLVEEDDWRDDHYGDHNATAYDDDDEVESYYTSRAAGRSCLTLQNRRWGSNGYVASGRMYARPSAAAKKYGKGKNKPFKGKGVACSSPKAGTGPSGVSPGALVASPAGSSPLAGNSFKASGLGSGSLKVGSGSGSQQLMMRGASGSASGSGSGSGSGSHVGGSDCAPRVIQHGFTLGSGSSSATLDEDSPSLSTLCEAPSGGLSLADFACGTAPKADKAGRRARRKAKRAAIDGVPLDF